MVNLDADWNQLWALENRIQQGSPLELTDDVCNLLRRAAPTVAINEAETEAALHSVESATALLEKIRSRIKEGTHRIMSALHRMYRLREKGDMGEARQEMRSVLAVEVVPHFREIAEGQLEEMDEL
jgi:DUSAM domain-containing protein